MYSKDEREVDNDCGRTSGGHLRRKRAGSGLYFPRYAAQGVLTQKTQKGTGLLAEVPSPSGFSVPF